MNITDPSSRSYHIFRLEVCPPNPLDLAIDDIRRLVDSLIRLPNLAFRSLARVSTEHVTCLRLGRHPPFHLAAILTLRWCLTASGITLPFAVADILLFVSSEWVRLLAHDREQNFLMPHLPTGSNALLQLGQGIMRVELS